MRNFRTNSTNLSDTRVAYTFLTALALLCTVMGLLASQRQQRLYHYELVDCYEQLAVCADSLHQYADPLPDTDRYAQAVRFANAIPQLPCEESTRTLLLDVAAGMRENAAEDGMQAVMRTLEADDGFLRTLSDTFAMLAALDYTDTDMAKRLINQALDSVMPALSETGTDTSDAADAVSAGQARITRESASRTVSSLFGSSMKIDGMSEDGQYWVAQAENLRMVFSAASGEMESFLYIRLGDSPKRRLSEKAVIREATDFAAKQIHGGGELTVSRTEELCGFTVVDLTAGKESCRVTADWYGRIWSFERLADEK
ncbi:MAG: hypothetical protein IJ493_10365 [Clostridia bacterium]|nr:hypothetical protein [Clostridia bacterium]